MVNTSRPDASVAAPVPPLEPPRPGPRRVEKRPIKAEVQDFSFSYGSFRAVKHVNLTFYEKAVTALIGPSGCGKTTLLRCFNRMHDLYPNNHYEGKIVLRPSGTNIVDPSTSPIEMRMRISMVFQKPNPFP